MVNIWKYHILTENNMAHFAQLDEENKVIQVIVADKEAVVAGVFGSPKTWLQTSYNTKYNQHPEGTPLRKNFAGVGYTYDPALDAFIPPKPFNSWILNEETCLWEPPVKYPEDNKFYSWNEEQQKWDEVE